MKTISARKRKKMLPRLRGPEFVPKCPACAAVAYFHNKTVLPDRTLKAERAWEKRCKRVAGPTKFCPRHQFLLDHQEERSAS